MGNIMFWLIALFLVAAPVTGLLWCCLRSGKEETEEVHREKKETL